MNKTIRIKSKRLAVCLLTCGLATAIQTTSWCADWLQFRGPNGGVIAEAKIPTKFGGESKTNIAWQTKLPGRSVGGAIVVKDQVITTSSSGMDQRRCHLISLDEKTGAIRWQQEFVARGRPFCHPTSANAAPTPASDGKYIYAFYSSNDIACVDLDGNLVWYRSLTADFPKAGNDVGMSSSPIVVDGVCVVQVECQGDSFALGLNGSDGQILWKMDRPKQANWASPTSATVARGEQAVVMQSGKSLVAVSPKTGKLIWDIDLRCSSIPSALASESRLFVPASGGLTAFQLSSSGGKPSMMWENNKLSSNACSPLLMGDKIFAINRFSLACGDMATGELKWQIRLGEMLSIWSSPVIANQKLYVFSDQGACIVVDLAQEKGQVIENNDLGEAVLGSPAIAGNAMYVRGVSSVFKIAEK